MGLRNTRGKKISQLRRSVTSQRRMQPELGENLSLYLRGTEGATNEPPKDYSIYDKLIVNIPKYKNYIKSYRAYLIESKIILEPGPVLTVCPSKMTFPACTFSAGSAF